MGKKAELKQQRHNLRGWLAQTTAERDRARGTAAALQQALAAAENEAAIAQSHLAANEARTRTILRAAGGGQSKRVDIVKVRRLCRETLDGSQR